MLFLNEVHGKGTDYTIAYFGVRIIGKGFWQQKACRYMGTQLECWAEDIFDTTPNHMHVVKSAIYPGMELHSTNSYSRQVTTEQGKR